MVYVGVGLGMLSSTPPIAAAELGYASFTQGSLGSALWMHAFEFLTRGLVQVFAPDFWAAIVFGMWAGSSGFLSRYVAAPFRHRGVTALGALFFFGATAVEIFAAARGGWDARTFNLKGIGWIMLTYVPASVGAIWFWLTISVLWGRSNWGERSVASLLVASGRAPLTQFIGQSIVFAVLFNKSLIGLNGELGRAAYSLIALATYLLLCAFIRAWLASGHRYGPMEIVWRGLTNALTPKRNVL